MRRYFRAIAIGLGASVLASLLFFGFMVSPVEIFAASIVPFVVTCVCLEVISHRVRTRPVLRHLTALAAAYLTMLVALGVILPLFHMLTTRGYEYARERMQQDPGLRYEGADSRLDWARVQIRIYFVTALSYAEFYLPVSYFATYITLIGPARSHEPNVA